MSPPKDNAYEDGRHYRLYRVPWRWPLKVPLIAEPRAQYEEYARSVLYTRYISYDTVREKSFWPNNKVVPGLTPPYWVRLRTRVSTLLYNYGNR